MGLCGMSKRRLKPPKIEETKPVVVTTVKNNSENVAELKKKYDQMRRKRT